MNDRIVYAERNRLLAQKVAQSVLEDRRPLRVVFYVTDPAKWSCSSLVSAMKQDPRFHVTIAVDSSPIFTNYENSCSFFSRIGSYLIRLWDPVSGVRLPVLDADPDIVFYQQPWYINAESAIDVVSLHALTAYVPYGYMLIDDNDSHYNLPFHMHLWRYFAENSFSQQIYIDFCPDVPGLVSLGYPKMDMHTGYIKSRNRNRRVMGKPHIVYAPHWSISTTKWSFSTFEQYGRYMLQFATENPQLQFTYRPHPNLQHQLLKDGIMTPVDYSGYVGAWRDLPNTDISESGDYIDLFYNSDLLVTDSISFLAEYLATENPIIRLDNPSSRALNAFGEKVLSLCCRVNSDYDLSCGMKAYAAIGVKNPYYVRDEMECILFPNYGHAGERIKDYIYKELFS